MNLEPTLSALRAEGDPLFDEALAAGHAPPSLEWPAWTRPERVARARGFFLANAPAFSFLLGTASLLECFACARGAKVLFAARGAVEQPNRRVGATARFVLELLGPNGGRTALSTLRDVRWRHAVIRARLRPTWDETPINQEDLLGTLLAFGLSPLLRLRALGAPVTREDVEDSLQFWAAAGHALGVRVDLLPRDEDGALALAHAIQRRNLAPSDEGRALADAILGSYLARVPTVAGRRAWLGLVRDLTGDEVCDVLGLPARAPGSTDWAARSLAATVHLGAAARQLGPLGAVWDRVAPAALGWQALRLVRGGR